MSFMMLYYGMNDVCTLFFLSLISAFEALRFEFILHVENLFELILNFLYQFEWQIILKYIVDREIQKA